MNSTSVVTTLAADVLELLMLTGCRVGEVLSLKPSNLDFERRVILLYAENTKTRQAREIPLSEASETILRRLTGPLPSYPYFHALARSAAQERGILFGYENWIFHDIRRTVGTRLAEAGISQSIIASLLGHSLSGVTAIYTRPSLEAVRHAVTILADLWQSNIIHFPQKRSANLMATFCHKRGKKRKKWQKLTNQNLPHATKPYKLNDLSGLEEGGQNRGRF